MSEEPEIIDTGRVNRPVWTRRSVQADALVTKAMELMDGIPLNDCPFCSRRGEAECVKHTDHRNDNFVLGYGVVCRHCFGRGPEHWCNDMSVLNYDTAAWCRLKAIFDWNTGRKVGMMMHPQYREICKLLMDADMAYLDDIKEKSDEDKGGDNVHRP